MSYIHVLFNNMSIYPQHYTPGTILKKFMMKVGGPKVSRVMKIYKLWNSRVNKSSEFHPTMEVSVKMCYHFIFMSIIEV